MNEFLDPFLAGTMRCRRCPLQPSATSFLPRPGAAARYRCPRCGTTPATMARSSPRFGQGWQAAGEPRIAAIEEGHASVWTNTFAAGLDTHPEEVPTGAGCCRSGEHRPRTIRPHRARLLGALYAFESQQPFTAQSKLKGLKVHYTALPSCCGEYFRLHEDELRRTGFVGGEDGGVAPCGPGGRFERLRTDEPGFARCALGTVCSLPHLDPK